MHKRIGFDAIVTDRASLPDATIRTFHLCDEPGKVLAPNRRHQKTFEMVEPGAVAFLLHTSGSTGQPKLVPVTHEILAAGAARAKAWFELTSDDRCLCISKLAHSHGLTLTLCTPIMTGGAVAVVSDPANVEAQKWLEDFKPTWFSAVPAMHKALVEDASRIAAPLRHRLRFAVSGGAFLNPLLRDEFESVLGAPLLGHYGSTESGQVAANSPHRRRAGTVGAADPGTLKIVPGAPGDVGEIWLRGPTVFSGYLDDPQLTASSFSDGWWMSGDLGRVDEQGFVTLHGRVSELINRGGDKVSPVEVEQALAAHPAVDEAAVFGVPHPRLGEDVAAAVVLTVGRAASEAELRAFLEQSLASFKVPRRIRFLSELPRRNGKLDRNKLTPQPTEPAPEDSPYRQELKARILAVWRRMLENPHLQGSDDFFEAGGDSLLARRMLLEIEEFANPNEVAVLLIDNPTAEAIAARLLSSTTHGKKVTALHAQGARVPIVYFHGDFAARGVYTHTFAKALGADQPLFVTAPHGLDRAPLPASIADMAKERVEELAPLLASGPCFVGGHCNGALVALEAARLLKARGFDVRGVLMIDPPAANASRSVRKLLNMLARAAPEHVTFSYELLVRLGKIGRLPWTHLLGKAQAGLRSTNETLWFEYTAVMARYFPEPVELPVIVFSAEYQAGPWMRISPETRTINVPGGHFGCITSHADFLAEKMRNAMDRIAHNAGA